MRHVGWLLSLLLLLVAATWEISTSINFSWCRACCNALTMWEVPPVIYSIERSNQLWIASLLFRDLLFNFSEQIVFSYYFQFTVVPSVIHDELFTSMSWRMFTTPSLPLIEIKWTQFFFENWLIFRRLLPGLNMI